MDSVAALLLALVAVGTTDEVKECVYHLERMPPVVSADATDWPTPDSIHAQVSAGLSPSDAAILSLVPHISLVTITQGTLSDESLEILLKSSSIKGLCFRESDITQSQVDRIANSNLEVLSIDRGQLDGRSLHNLVGSQLRELYLRPTTVKLNIDRSWVGRLNRVKTFCWKIPDAPTCFPPAAEWIEVRADHCPPLPQLAKCRSLKTLKLQVDELPEDADDYFNSFVDLKTVVIRGARIPRLNLELPKLANLAFEECQLPNDPFNDINSPQLNFLSVVGSSIDNKSIATLAKYDKLKLLTLERAGLDDDSIKPLQRFRSLTSLTLSDNAITDKGIKSLLPLESLSYLVLSGCLVSDNGVEDLIGLLSLNHLFVERTWVTPAAQAKFELKPVKDQKSGPFLFRSYPKNGPQL